MLSVFQDERINFRLESLFDGCNVYSKGLYKYKAKTMSYSFDVTFDPTKNKLCFTDSTGFSFNISFEIINQEVVFSLNQVVVEKNEKHLITMLNKICTEIMQSYSTINTHLRKKHSSIDFSIDFIRLCVFTNKFFEETAKSFLDSIIKSKSVFHSDGFYTIHFRFKENGFSVDFSLKENGNDVQLFSFEEVGDDVLFTSHNSSFTKVLLQNDNILFFDLGALYFYDFFINLLYRYLNSNSITVYMKNAKTRLSLLHNLKKEFHLKESIFPNHFVFEKDVINFEHENELFLTKNVDYVGLNNNSSVFKPFDQIMLSEQNKYLFMSDEYLSILEKTSLNLSNIPKERLSHLDLDNDNTFSYESIKDLPFDSFINVLKDYSFMNIEINNSLQEFLKTYSFISERQNMISLMSKHFLFVNIAEDFKDFTRILFNSPSVSMFEDKFLDFIHNYHAKLKEIELSIEKQLSDELDILLTFAEKRSSYLKENILFSKGSTKNTN